MTVATVLTPQHLLKYNIQIYLEMYAVWVAVVYRSRCQGPELKDSAIVEATSTVKREWI